MKGANNESSPCDSHPLNLIGMLELATVELHCLLNFALYCINSEWSEMKFAENGTSD